ncbi:MAG: ketoacyl-ACP synthase III [Nitrospirae bacterium]|nr:ketoacyl-ACP synthase III [Candidatus Manganitrophaceae bacterium]
MSSEIIGTGRALPQRVVTNDALAKQFNLSASEIFRKTGIQKRYWAEPSEKPSTLAVAAAKNALETAGCHARDIDLILVSTTTPDMYFPSTACLVQRDLKARSIPAFDINASCSGFLYALSLADQYIKNGTAKTVLVIATDLKSRFLNPKDQTTAILFGDGAGAVVLRRGVSGIQKITLGADGAFQELIDLPGGGARLPITLQSLKEERHYMQMQGKRLFRIAVRKMESTLTQFLSEASLSFDEIDFYLFHQANLRILEALFKRISLPRHKTEITLSQFGNTSSSTIPIALDVAVRAGKLKKGDRVVFSAFGGGVTWGNVLLNW